MKQLSRLLQGSEVDDPSKTEDAAAELHASEESSHSALGVQLRDYIFGLL